MQDFWPQKPREPTANFSSAQATQSQKRFRQTTAIEPPETAKTEPPNFPQQEPRGAVEPARPTGTSTSAFWPRSAGGHSKKFPGPRGRPPGSEPQKFRSPETRSPFHRAALQEPNFHSLAKFPKPPKQSSPFSQKLPKFAQQGQILQKGTIRPNRLDTFGSPIFKTQFYFGTPAPAALFCL